VVLHRLSVAGPAQPGSHVEARGIGKRYGGVAALADVSLVVRRGEIHGLCGENGAGKSTLGKIIVGSVQPDSGELVVEGRPVRYRSPRDAIADGITMIAQELALVPQLSVLDNVFLGHEYGNAGMLDRAAARQHYARLAERIGLTIHPATKVAELRTAEEQQVEILRALARDARLIVMDEPTAALSRPEVGHLHGIARELRSQGVTLIYVSHFLGDMLDICDSVTVLKDGRFVRTAAAARETVDTLVTSMLGRSLDDQFPASSVPSTDAPVVLSVRGLSRPAAFEDVSFDVRAGEIVGLAGLVGAGRTEIARAIFGADRAEGIVEIRGKEYRHRSPAASIRRGIAFLPESRKDDGLIMMRSVRENVSAAHLDDVVRFGFVRRAREDRVVDDVLSKVETRAASISMPVAALSGGNQQKVALAKWLVRSPALLIADEPTRGIDVGAKRAIYHLIHGLAASGVGVLLISSELEELLGLAHRTFVVRAGRIVGTFSREDADEESIMRAAFGGSELAAHG
jgi:rhamnose transport system ATP-binding protein